MLWVVPILQIIQVPTSGVSSTSLSVPGCRSMLTVFYLSHSGDFGALKAFKYDEFLLYLTSLDNSIVTQFCHILMLDDIVVALLVESSWLTTSVSIFPCLLAFGLLFIFLFLSVFIFLFLSSSGAMAPNFFEVVRILKILMFRRKIKDKGFEFYRKHFEIAPPLLYRCDDASV